ncbi:preprotein translocase subunit SecA [Hafnia alvei]|uniref:Preprotein translocase subunit SecA n=1 Tax=Hafnia alvei TaxID=569 RepID=A0A377PPJ2_HAFAL|nr:preprotein translocase subunit SecA [Hafnia alvei]
MKKPCANVFFQQAVEVYQRKEEVVGVEMMRNFEKGVMLQTLDSPVERAFGCHGLPASGYPICVAMRRKDPKQEYKRESFAMFAAMLESLKYEVISVLSKVQVRMPEEVEAMEQQRREEAERLARQQQLSHVDDATLVAQDLASQTGERKVGP